MPTFIDITGQKFGYLVAIRGLSNGAMGKWLFHCDCGKDKVLLKQNVCQGKTKSCGCLGKILQRIQREKNQLALSGQRFGRLVALEYTFQNRHSCWRCRCDCGKEITVRSAYLIIGHTKSCGCIQTYRHQEHIVGLKKLHYRYRFSAKRNSRKFEIPLEVFKTLTSQNCFYCGRPPASIMKSHSKHSEYVYNGLDRVDSKKGYTIDNVVPCCIYCNRMKLDYTQDNFKDMVQRIYLHWIKGEIS